jgi:predicted glycogen debranching enzyme
MELGWQAPEPQCEWLVTNGLGSYASGSVGDPLTRRYHGLFVAALQPPLGRRVLLSKFDVAARYNGVDFPLSSNCWRDGAIAPNGRAFLTAFRLDDFTPVWSWSFADALVERRIWMTHGEQATFIEYRLADASAPLELTLKAYINDRDYHSLTHAYDLRTPPATIDGARATMRMNGGTLWHLDAGPASLELAQAWYFGFKYELEEQRGLDDIEDLYHALTIRAALRTPGDRLVLRASLNDGMPPPTPPSAPREHTTQLRAAWRAAQPHLMNAPNWIDRLVLAADQFIVDRTVEGTAGKTVIAGYHWFGDWGRDTMIALPGLTLATGRAPIAKMILETFARLVNQGMLPNRFPDDGQAPEYNTVDAALLFVEAVRLYHASTQDAGLVGAVYDSMCEIVDWYTRGTRYGIALDDDGLLRAGVPGVQLTWMDAKVGDVVITPRVGKPVEINAMWYNALRAMESFATLLGKDPSPYHELANRCQCSFGRFWNADAGYPYDVIDGPSGNDASIRPNAIIAASLGVHPFEPDQLRALVECASTTLLTPLGLRSLAPNDPSYIGSYNGSVDHRDEAYHRGTVWPWLIGPFARAHARAYGDKARARRFVEAVGSHLWCYGVGTLAEIADGDPPHAPRGCIAQAWSVAEVLRAWHEMKD